MKLLNFLTLTTFFVTVIIAHAQTNPDLPHPSLLTKKYLEEISKREIGQNKFAIKTNHFRGIPTSRGADAPQGGANGGSRDIQESDVYKIGKKDKKELFLLNRYRGFQVISFDKGLENPRIVGRFPVYSNWKSEMYYLESQDKVLVVNTEWSYRPNHWQSSYNTNLYLIDVSNSEQPKMITETSIQGLLQESRMVGDVLYTITNDGNWNELKARVTSVKLDKDSLNIVEHEDLHGTNGWVGTMNVTQYGARYYIISSLTNWNVMGDTINVLDITSEKGQIEKLFKAKARGRISERSETFIHKDHLFMVSNYRVNNNSPMRISVEAVSMEKSTTVVEAKENMRVSVGDTNGVHASLQDVRVSGDLLYAFWVPANNIDPFELFDISEPSKGIKHLGQLQFDGWVSKAFPITYQNKKFVLGLGWIIPATSEDNKRYPQAKLFEIKQDGQTIKHEVAASLAIQSDELWSSLNQLDKFFEIMEEAPGVYNILFPVTFRKNWQSGGKLVGVDLNTKKITEGANIIAEQNWLSRVFVNREIHAINAFNDLSLATFDQNDLTGTNIAKTVSVLELARNIIDFKVLPGQLGIQIINTDKTVEIRHVSLDAVDAEKDKVLNSMTLKGKYHWHTMKKDKLYVITSTYKKAVRGNEGYRYETEVFDKAFLNIINLKNLTQTAQNIELAGTSNTEDYYAFNPTSTMNSKQEVITIGKEFFLLKDDSLVKLTIEEGCQYFFNPELNTLELKMLGEQLYAYNTFKVVASDEGSAPNRADGIFSMPFMKKLNIDGDNVLCSNSVNIPGEPVLVAENLMVAKESSSRGGIYPRYSYGYDRHMPWRPVSNKTYSLMLQGDEASMVDILNKDITGGLFDGGFVTFTPSESRVDMWSLLPTGELYSRPEYLNYNQQNASMIAVQKLNNRNFVIMKNENKVDLFEIKKSKKMTKVDITSSFDTNVSDGSAEFIFAIESLKASEDLSKIFVSQGLHGMTEIILK